MPSTGVVQAWRFANDAFNAQYSKAREFQAETLFDEILEIADTVEEGTRVVETDKGQTIHHGDMIEHRKLRIQARQWMLPRINRKMTDKSQVDHVSSDGSIEAMTEEAKALRLTAIHQEAMRRLQLSKAQANNDKVDDGSDLV